MTQVVDFPDFVRVQGPTYIKSGPQFIVNAQLRNRATLGVLQRGNNLKRVLQGGQDIRRMHMDATQITSGFYDVEQVGTPVSVPFTSEVSAPWRQWRESGITWRDEVISKNVPSGLTGDAITAKYADLWDGIQQRGWVSIQEFAEKEIIWGIPDVAAMEGTPAAGVTGKPMSLIALLNEHTNGLYPATMDLNGGTWTTKQGRNPATFTDWVPTQVGYNSLTPYAADSLLEGIREAFRKWNFNLDDFTPGNYAPNATPEGAGRSYDMPGVVTSSRGIGNVQRVWGASNDRWQDPNDPFGFPKYMGVPFVYAAALDTAAIFPTGAGVTRSTELDTAGANNAGPRYFGLRSAKIYMVYQEGWLNKTFDPLRHPQDPTGWIVWVYTTGNMFAESLRETFILYPTADIN